MKMENAEDIFWRATNIADREERDAYLESACGDDIRLRERVFHLLNLAERARAFFGSEASPEDADLGSYIGRYKLLQRIGEGGMGVVYLAMQRGPLVRNVALKVIKAGMDTRTVIERFAAERQALASMDHPNIARVFDAGETTSGRPYFVMELVSGVPITRWCEENCSSARQRLELVIEVCSAIQHAHQKGIIHRDIKPSNVLVSCNGDKPAVKVIDFGIAIATQQTSHETVLQQFLGTPAYMSPEQVGLRQSDIDTRTDIYALGVLMYELLTGSTPFDAMELVRSGIDEMRRVITEIDPPRPSARATTQRKMPVASYTPEIKALRHDVDWIVMKCLEKDRERRYSTAAGLATDIRCHLMNEPVSARPPSKIYRWRKAIVRHRVEFAALVLVISVLVIGTAVSTWLYVREARARERATIAERRQGLMRIAAESARRSAEAGQTALLYWQAMDAMPNLSTEDRVVLTNVPDLAKQVVVVIAKRYDRTFNLLTRAATINSGCNWAVNPEDGPYTWVPNRHRAAEVADAALLRARVALSQDDSETACSELLVLLTFARHIATDGAIVSTMTQVDIEARLAQFVAAQFSNFSHESLGRLARSLQDAPAHVNVEVGVLAEQQSGANWILRQIGGVEGNEAAALARVKESLSEIFGPEEWVDQVIAAAGNSVSGVLSYVRGCVPYYEQLRLIASASPEHLTSITAEVYKSIENSTNLVVLRILPNMERARRREIQSLTKVAMVQAAAAYAHGGKSALNLVLDPFGTKPFDIRNLENGFELRSRSADYGFEGTLLFKSPNAPP